MDGRMISNVDQSAIKDWDMRRVVDELYLAEGAGKREGEKTYTKAVANEHERRARQPVELSRRRLRSPLGRPSVRPAAIGIRRVFILSPFRQNHLISHYQCARTAHP
jgi:hypothetical protein